MDLRFFILFLGVVLIQIQYSFSLPLENLKSESNSTAPANQTQVKKARQDDFVNSTTLQLEKEHEEKMKAQSLTQLSNSIENATLNFTTSPPTTTTTTITTTVSPLSITNTTANTTNTTTTTTENPIDSLIMALNETSGNITNPDNTTTVVETIELIEEIPLDTPIEIERTNLETDHYNYNDNDNDNDNERVSFPSIFRDFDDMKEVNKIHLKPEDSIDFAPDDLGDDSFEVKSQVESVAFFYPKSKF